MTKNEITATKAQAGVQGQAEPTSPSVEMEATQRDIQEKTARWVSTLINVNGLDVSKLANLSGVERTALSRSINGNRDFKLHEVVLIARAFRKSFDEWNIVASAPRESKLLPLLGEVSNAAWRKKKGTEMKVGTAPIEPIVTKEVDGLNQVCYFIADGKHAGKYAVCIDARARSAPLSDGDILIVKDTGTLQRDQSPELERIILRKVCRIGDRITLIPNDLSEIDEPELDLSSSDIRVDVVGFVIGFFVPV
jgi:hypothetical protein